ncbi:MAG: hypothetical protein A2W31_05035 [Planctomycetes bacterium RBG_16_64_10]|nr:MAG: hypothetical protein A2W31_05035 [Planctomycetes bacterium RBG_16_64_10]
MAWLLEVPPTGHHSVDITPHWRVFHYYPALENKKAAWEREEKLRTPLIIVPLYARVADLEKCHGE